MTRPESYRVTKVHTCWYCKYGIFDCRTTHLLCVFGDKVQSQDGQYVVNTIPLASSRDEQHRELLAPRRVDEQGTCDHFMALKGGSNE